ncbi:MAG: polyheme membrane-associated cytochrome C [Chloroflexi bacterium]|nr:polyheme membrane-associated cytochrome C [Chloroflexota bacterium]
MKRNGILLVLIVLVMVAIALLLWQPWVAKTQPVSEIAAAWSTSGHADYASESFNHWNEEETPEVPTGCAKCHSNYGLRDYLGLDGSAVDAVDAPAKIGSVVTCETCHNPAADSLTAVTFPSGETVDASGPATVCMECHQATTSGVAVAQSITGMDPDTVSEDLKSVNPHYYAAAATQYGGLAKGGYEYEGKDYIGHYEHSENAQTCTDCHNPHDLTVDPANCTTCHSNVVDIEDARQIRQTADDYDGDGNTTEGMADEIEGMRQALIAGIQKYAAEELGTPILFEPEAHPYFFIDTNANGVADEGEAERANQYVAWSPRLLRTTFNLLFVTKDPAAYVHNPRYAAELLYDSLDDLSQVVDIDLSGMVRP